MAYYLQFDGVNDYVSLPFSVAIPAASNGSVIFTAESPADSEVYGMFGGISERFIIRSSDIFFRLNGVNGNTITHATIRTFVPTYDRANKHTYELRKTLYIDGIRTQVHLYIDGVYCGLLISHYNSTGPDIKFNSIGAASTSYARMNLYSFDIVVNGVYTVRYDPSASNGTGSTLIDTEGGSNGTLVNFPTNNSQWLYDTDEPVDSTVSRVGLSWAPSIRNYDTLRQWRDAKFASTTYEQAYCRGYLGNSFVTIASGQMTGGALIRGEIPFIGNNVHELAKLESSLTLGGGTQQNPIIAENLYVRHTGTAQSSLSASNYNIARKSYIEHTNSTGSNGGILYLTSNGYAENCVVNSLGTDNLFGIRLGNSGKAKNCIAFGPSLRGGYSNWAASVFENCFFFGATDTDILLVNGATKINVATGDLTGDITGYTSNELVNFDTSDYRIKSTSNLSSLNIGAFFENSVPDNAQNESSSAELNTYNFLSAESIIVNIQEHATEFNLNTETFPSASTVILNWQYINSIFTILLLSEFNITSTVDNIQNIDSSFISLTYNEADIRYEKENSQLQTSITDNTVITDLIVTSASVANQVTDTDISENTIAVIELNSDVSNLQSKDAILFNETYNEISYITLVTSMQDVTTGFIDSTTTSSSVNSEITNHQDIISDSEISVINDLIIDSGAVSRQTTQTNIFDSQLNDLILYSIFLSEQNKETSVNAIVNNTAAAETVFTNNNSQNILSIILADSKSDILISNNIRNEQVIDTDVSDYTVTNLDIDSQINAELIQNRTSSINVNSRSVIVCDSELVNEQNIAELINSSTTSEIYNNSLVLNSQAINSICTPESIVSISFNSDALNNQTTDGNILFNTVATTTAEAEIINHCLVDTNIIDVINSVVSVNSTVHNTQINDSSINDIAVSETILNNVISNVQAINSSASFTTSSQTSADTSIHNIDQNNQNISSSLLVNTRNSIVLDSIGEFEQNGESSFDLNSLSEISISVSAINKIEEFSNISVNLESNVISNNTYTNIQSIASSIATITESTASTDIEINISQSFSSVISATTVDNLIIDTLAEQAQIINTLIDTVSNTLIVADNLYRQAGPQNILSDIVSDNNVFEDLFSEIVHVQENSSNFEILSNTVILIDNSNRNNELILQHESSSVNLISNSILNINSLILNRQRRFTFANLETVSAVLFENEYANFDSYWDDSIPLFQEDQNITQLSIAFDNNGSPVVFYNISGTLRLFDISQNLQIFEVNGRDPVLFYNTSAALGLPVSVVALFINSSNQIIAKTQADNFTSDTIVSQVNSTTLLSKVIENNKQQIKVFEYSKV